MENSRLVFVYGTLKRGGTNHAFMAGQTFVGTATTEPGYCLVHLGEFPGLISCGKDQTAVSGEVWAVDQPCLAALDQLEGVDEGLYQRTAIRLLPPFDAVHVDTYFYTGTMLGQNRVADGIWPPAHK